MNQKSNIFIIFFAVLLTSFLFACQKSDNDNSMQNGLNFNLKDYEEYRKQTADFFANDSNSPLTGVPDKDLIQLEFYEPDSKYKTLAKLEKSAQVDTVIILTSKLDKPRQMLKIGKLKFQIDSNKLELSAYQPIDNKSYIFVPFADQTNSKTTYYAGRYLDLEPNNKNEYILDFNLAYHPYCLYNDKYTCPLIPAENVLNIAIEAGEKLYTKNQK